MEFKKEKFTPSKSEGPTSLSREDIDRLFKMVDESKKVKPAQEIQGQGSSQETGQKNEKKKVFTTETAKMIYNQFSLIEKIILFRIDDGYNFEERISRHEKELRDIYDRKEESHKDSVEYEAEQREIYLRINNMKRFRALFEKGDPRFAFLKEEYTRYLEISKKESKSQ